ncbi:MAG: M15 family metallopeptidase [Ignavibacteriae bacterium]|nr:M15 family metallopeptidase [Ignavibacteriota bacterium]
MLLKLFISLLFYSVVFPQNDTSLVLLKNIDSTIVTDVRYATTNNFTGKVLYKTDKVMLRKIVADSLAKVNAYFKEFFNLRIKIFDGYRPLLVQKLMWKIMPDDRYVANPAKGSRHNRGAAVDITLVDSLGKQLDMGTEYDNFTKKAHPSYKQFPEIILGNRNLLSEIMKKFGFHPITSEWWHFDFQGWRKYSILDVTIE